MWVLREWFVIIRPTIISEDLFVLQIISMFMVFMHALSLSFNLTFNACFNYYYHCVWFNRLFFQKFNFLGKSISFYPISQALNTTQRSSLSHWQKSWSLFYASLRCFHYCPLLGRRVRFRSVFHGGACTHVLVSTTAAGCQ